jgi:hypothetical protein
LYVVRNRSKWFLSNEIQTNVIFRWAEALVCYNIINPF